MNNSLVTGRILLANADGTEKFTNESPGIVQLSGSNVAIPVDLQYSQLSENEALPVLVTKSTAEYSWLTGGTMPTPIEDFAWGVEFNASTGAITAYGWSGSVWVEVV